MEDIEDSFLWPRSRPGLCMSISWQLMTVLPDWPFLGQISEIWPHIKLIGLENYSGPFGFFWPHLMLAGHK